MTHWDQEPDDKVPDEWENEDWEVVFDTAEEAVKDPNARLRLRSALSVESQRRPFRYDDY
jgi:hypothetical protein